MKNILVPIDFSNNAHNAYLFARELAAKYAAKLHIINIYPGANIERAPLETYDDKILGLERQLTNFVDRFPDEGGVITQIEVEKEIKVGFSAVQKIVAISYSYDLIVMGTQRNHTISEKILGSVASGVAQKAHCPVLLVPKGARFLGFKKLVFASNWESAKKETTISKIINWGQLFQADIDFVHVSPEYEVKDFEKVKSEIQQHINNIGGYPGCNYSFSNISEESPLKGIQGYAKKQDSDLIVLTNRQRQLWNNLFFTSMTKEMAMNIHLPILVFHFQKED